MRMYTKLAKASDQKNHHHAALDSRGWYTHTLVAPGDEAVAQVKLAPMHWDDRSGAPVYRVAELTVKPPKDGDTAGAVSRGKSLLQQIQAKHPGAHILYDMANQEVVGAAPDTLRGHATAMGFLNHAAEPDWMYLSPPRKRGKTAALRTLGIL